jgi:hypothetical protein
VAKHLSALVRDDIALRDHFMIANLLARDAHPWVVREVLESVFTQRTSFEPGEIESLISNALEAIVKFEAKGWDREQVMRPLLRLLSVAPISMMSKLNIS